MGTEHTVVTRENGRLLAACFVCGSSVDYPDKGLGRATLATWRTRHQHAEGPR